jgi:hypothetical protein
LTGHIQTPTPQYVTFAFENNQKYAARHGYQFHSFSSFEEIGLFVFAGE